jgi:Phage integrase family
MCRESLDAFVAKGRSGPWVIAIGVVAMVEGQNVPGVGCSRYPASKPQVLTSVRGCCFKAKLRGSIPSIPEGSWHECCGYIAGGSEVAVSVPIRPRGHGERGINQGGKGCMADLVALAQPSNSATCRNHPPRRRPNLETREREYLRETEVEALIDAVRKRGGRLAQRDALLILMAFTHALRAVEVVRLRWSAIDLKGGTIHVNRVKNGAPSVHPLRGRELRGLRGWARIQGTSPMVFTASGGAPMSPRSVHRVVAQAGVAAKLPFAIHPHMLRHALGYRLANKGIDTRAIAGFMGHRAIQHTVRYTALAPGRFDNLWED